MSNVLIGIIGVILFIGLALAGALFLGPRFQESANTSKAAAAVQAVSQVANAASMFEVSEGRAVSTLDNSNSLKTAGYLKEIPRNTVMQNMNFEPSMRSADGGVDSSKAAYVIMPVSGYTGSPQGTDSKVCDAINLQTRSVSSSPQLTAMPGSGQPVSGCFRDTTGFASYPGGYLAYSRI